MDPAPIVQLDTRADLLDLTWGHPPPDALPVAAWRAAATGTLDRYGWQALTYGYPAGPAPLLDWLAEHLAALEPGGPDPRPRTFVTAGASHALELLCGVLARPGDLVLVDSPTYHLALRVLADHRVETVAAPADESGPDPAGTEALISRARRAGRRVALLYSVPTFANPTGRSLPTGRRAELVAMAQRTGVPVVEDDTYRELVYDGVAPASLWAGSGGQGVIRIGSFAKTVAPGLRLGWINAAPDLIARLVDRGYVDSGGGVNHSTALTMAVFGAGGAYQRHLAGLRPRYAAQRDALVAGLRAALPDLVVPVPAGGWFLWVELPVPAAGVLPAARAAGLTFLTGDRFHVGPGGERHIRLAFSRLPAADLAGVGTRLARALGVPG